MTITEDKVQEILKSIHGSKRASDGVLIPTDDGMFHLRNIFSEKELEGILPEETFFFEFCSKKEIIRLRDIKGPHDYLLRIRANAIADSPRAVRVMAARRKDYEAKGRSWTLSHYYHSKDYYHKSYVQLLSRDKMKRVKDIPTGLAFIQEVNALWIKSLAGDVVLVSESLEKFYYFMTIAFYGDQLGFELIDQADALLISIRIINGSEALDFDIDPRADLPREKERAIESLVKRQMQFTFGHEFTHYLCDHNPSDEITLGTMKQDSFMNDLAMYNHNLEYEADYYSLKNIKNKKEEFRDITQGAFSVLLYLHFIENVRKSYVMKNFSISISHPTALDRIYHLHSNLGRQSPIDDDDVSGMINASGEMCHILQNRLKGQRDDLLTFYGSLYLHSYFKKRRVDRIDF